MKNRWIKVDSDIQPPESSSRGGVKRVLVVVRRPGAPRYWTTGWFYGGALQEWRIDGSPNDYTPYITHWQSVVMP